MPKLVNVNLTGNVNLIMNKKIKSTQNSENYRLKTSPNEFTLEYYTFERPNKSP